MDFPISEFAPTTRPANGASAGRAAPDSLIGSFADLMSDVSDAPVDDGFYDELDTPAAYDDRVDDDPAEDDARADRDDEDNADESDQARRDDGEVPDAAAAGLAQISPADLSQASTDIPASLTGTGADTGATPSAAPQASGTVSPHDQLAAALAGNSASGAASLAEARVLNRRANVLQANAQHAEVAKAQLTKQEGAAADTSGRTTETAKTTPTAQEATPPKSEAGRLDQAFRAAFPQNPNGAATPAAATTTVPPSPLLTLTGQGAAVTDRLMMSSAGDAAADSGTQIQNNAERANNLATAKAAAARTPFNLPGSRPAEQVSVQIQNAARNGSDRISIRLTPAALGKVEVKLELSPDKTVQAIVTAEKPETLDMLERDARTLQRALEEAGLRTNSDSLSFERREPGTAADRGSDSNDDPANGANGSDTAGPDDGTGQADVELSHRRRHDGLLDVEV